MVPVKILVRVYKCAGAVGARVGEKMVQLPLVPRVGDSLNLKHGPDVAFDGMPVKTVQLSEDDPLPICEIEEICSDEEGNDQRAAVQHWEESGFKFE